MEFLEQQGQYHRYSILFEARVAIVTATRGSIVIDAMDIKVPFVGCWNGRCQPETFKYDVRAWGLHQAREIIIQLGHEFLA